MVCSSTVNWSWGSVRSIEVFAESHGWGMYILQSPVHQPSLLFKVLWKAKGKFQPFLHCMHAPCMFRFSVHAHMCVPSFDDGCTSHLFGSYLNFKGNFCIKSLQKIWKHENICLKYNISDLWLLSIYFTKNSSHSYLYSKSGIFIIFEKWAIRVVADLWCATSSKCPCNRTPVL